jgi:hypothetical protein
MRKRILIGIGLLALFAAGVGLGMVVQYPIQLGVADAVLRPFFEAFYGGGPSGPAPPLEQWRYPGAADQSFGQAPMLSFNGQVPTPQPEFFASTTVDDYEKVAAHYGAKLGFFDGAIDTSGFGLMGTIFVHNSNAGFQTLVTDGKVPRPLQENDRPVRAVCLRQTCRSYDVVVFITRAEKEEHTHIILLYNPKIANPASAP